MFSVRMLAYIPVSNRLKSNICFRENKTNFSDCIYRFYYLKLLFLFYNNREMSLSKIDLHSNQTKLQQHTHTHTNAHEIDKKYTAVQRTVGVWRCSIATAVWYIYKFLRFKTRLAIFCSGHLLIFTIQSIFLRDSIVCLPLPFLNLPALFFPTKIKWKSIK